ncbi:free fatty acid receptor 4 isoform X1 [Hippopotamus amphibius kiboko]|uniref:free fatty acid receptor 4 isoform X1 n=1 Tax=Hippopotamus amphibius kiboko TaxID=575201 RepID=UPI00259AC82B|nr:free fatty acid receptor 4 isoform X1 [Hippopotamus amphibius kiboko]
MSPECAQAAGTGLARSPERANRTRFPFFSDVKGDHRLVLSSVETAVLALIFAVSLLGNVCALVLVARRRRRGTTSSLVLNLFCADLLFTCAIPPVLAVRWTEAWLLGPVACHLLFYVMTLSGSVTILTLAAVSLERMVCIVHLQRGVRGPGRRARAALLALIWGYATIAALPLCIFFRVVPQRFPGADQEILICTLIWPSVAGEISWDVSFVTLNFLVPGLLIVISYSKILQVCLLQAPWLNFTQACCVFLQITKASRRRLTMSLAYSESHQLRVSQQDVRLFRTLFLLMVSFFIMWSPIIITILLILVQNFNQNLVIWPSLFFWVVAFTFANSAVNPILYNMSLFRNELRKFFHCFFFSEKGAMFTDTSVRRNDLSIISS